MPHKPSEYGNYCKKNSLPFLEETRVVTNTERAAHHRFARSAENIAIVSESVTEEPKESILRRFQELGLSYDTLWCSFHLDLHLHPYKVQVTQNLKPSDHSQCRKYVQWMLDQQAKFFKQNFLQR